MTHFRQLASGVMAAGVLLSAVAPAAVFTSAGADPAAITPTLDSYRAALGALNPNAPGSVGTGRREINWDAVPDGFADTNPLPADFFNANFAPRARGVVFSTPGTGFLVSADSDNPSATPRDFAGINPSYADTFEQFSAQRLFTAVDSTITDVHFFVPGEATPALSRGFGAVFSDVDLDSSTKIELYDENDQLIEQIAVPGFAGQQTYAFAGAVYDNAIVARVRIISGNAALDADTHDQPDLGIDVAVMDDFVYGEPVAVPEPAAAVLLIGAAGLAIRRR